MKKIIFLFTLLILFTGCTVKNINDYETNEVINVSLSGYNYKPNTFYDGYKFYLPRGIKIVDKKDYNIKFLSGSNYYYLYVDVVSYYHKKEINYTVNDNLYLSKKINYKGKNGYIEITEKDDNNYLVIICYNYSRIEAIVEEKDLNTTINDSIKILSSMYYNDKILSTIIGDNILNYDEEEFNLFDSKRKDGTFLDYIEEYDVYDDTNDKKDNNIIDSER